jgi:hypothetical protein
MNQLKGPADWRIDPALERDLKHRNPPMPAQERLQDVDGFLVTGHIGGVAPAGRPSQRPTTGSFRCAGRGPGRRNTVVVGDDPEDSDTAVTTIVRHDGDNPQVIGPQIRQLRRLPTLQDAGADVIAVEPDPAAAADDQSAVSDGFIVLATADREESDTTLLFLRALFGQPSTNVLNRLGCLPVQCSA